MFLSHPHTYARFLYSFTYIIAFLYVSSYSWCNALVCDHGIYWSQSPSICGSWNDSVEILLLSTVKKRYMKDQVKTYFGL